MLRTHHPALGALLLVVATASPATAGTWAWVYSTPYRLNPEQVVTLTDGALAVRGSSEDSSGRWLAVVESDGAVRWALRSPDAPLGPVAALPGGGACVVVQGPAPQVLALAADGSVAWSLVPEAAASARFDDVESRPDGGVLLVGSRLDAAGARRPWLVAMTAAGNVEREMVLSLEASFDRPIDRIVLGGATVSSTGDILLTGETDAPEVEAFAWRISPEGTPRWSRKLGTYRWIELPPVAGPDDTAIVSYAGGSFAHVLAVEADGSVAWSWLTRTPGGAEEGERLRAAAWMPDGTASVLVEKRFAQAPPAWAEPPGFLRRVGPDGLALPMLHPLAGPASSPDSPRDLAGVEDGFVVASRPGAAPWTFGRTTTVLLSRHEASGAVGVRACASVEQRPNDRDVSGPSALEVGAPLVVRPVSTAFADAPAPALVPLDFQRNDRCSNCPDPASDQVDGDGDGIGDSCDTCATVTDPTNSDWDGDGAGDACDLCSGAFDPANLDSDGDGLGDACDACPGVADPAQEDRDRDGAGDACDACTDVDGDGFADAPGPATTCDADLCPGTFSELNGDVDADGIGDPCDACPSLPDPLQADADRDGTGDACDACPDVRDDQADADGDGAGDACDACPDLAEDGADADGDAVPDACDDCPGTFDPAQRDCDADGAGEACQAGDFDGDGVANGVDDCPCTDDPGQEDLDADGIGDACDACPGVADPWQLDTDGDGTGDACTVVPEPQDLIVARPAAGTLLLTWATVDADAYDVHRGTLAALQDGRYDHQRFGACGLGMPEARVAEPRGGAYFLVTGRIGLLESSCGLDSLSRERPPARVACP